MLIFALLETSLVDVVADVIGDAYPELQQGKVKIRSKIAIEEAYCGGNLLHVSLVPFHLQLLCFHPMSIPHNHVNVLFEF